jgi:predicted ATPase
MGMLDPGQTAESLGDFGAGWAEWQVLATLDAYVNLVGEHLEVLDDLDRRMQRLADSLTGKLAPKKVEVTGAGIRVWTREGLDLPLSLLSSGEQHEFVQDCEFYFGIRRGTLLLIDEPETSLHILWQRLYVSDLLRLVAETDSDAILATHSANIIHGYRHLMLSFDPKGDQDAGSARP